MSVCKIKGLLPHTLCAVPHLSRCVTHIFNMAAPRVSRREPLPSDLVCTVRSADWDTNEAVCRAKFYAQTQSAEAVDRALALSSRGRALLRGGQIKTADLNEFYTSDLRTLDLSDVSCIASPLLGFILFRFGSVITHIILPKEISAANAVVAMIWNARRGLNVAERRGRQLRVTGRLALVRILDRQYARAIESGVVFENDADAEDLTVAEVERLFERVMMVAVE